MNSSLKFDDYIDLPKEELVKIPFIYSQVVLKTGRWDEMIELFSDSRFIDATENSLKYKDLSDNLFTRIPFDKAIELLDSAVKKEGLLKLLKDQAETNKDISKISSKIIRELHLHLSFMDCYPLLVESLPYDDLKVLFSKFIPDLSSKLETPEVFYSALEINDANHFTKLLASDKLERFVFNWFSVAKLNSTHKPRVDFVMALLDVFAEIYEYLLTLDNKSPLIPYFINTCTGYFEESNVIKTNKVIRGRFAEIIQNFDYPRLFGVSLNSLVNKSISIGYLRYEDLFPLGIMSKEFFMRKYIVPFLEKESELRLEQRENLQRFSLSMFSSDKKIRECFISLRSNFKNLWTILYNNLKELLYDEVQNGCFTNFKEMCRFPFHATEQKVLSIFPSYDQYLGLVRYIIEEIFRNKTVIVSKNKEKYTQICAQLLYVVFTGRSPQLQGGCVPLPVLPVENAPVNFLEPEFVDKLIIESIRDPNNNGAFAGWIIKQQTSVLVGVCNMFSSVSSVSLLLPESNRSKLDKYGFLGDKNVVESFIEATKFWESSSSKVITDSFRSYYEFSQRFLAEIINNNDMEYLTKVFGIFERFLNIFSEHFGIHKLYDFALEVATNPLALHSGYTISKDFPNKMYIKLISKIPYGVGNRVYLADIVSRLICSHHQKLPNLALCASELIKMCLELLYDGFIGDSDLGKIKPHPQSVLFYPLTNNTDVIKSILDFRSSIKIPKELDVFLYPENENYSKNYGNFCVDFGEILKEYERVTRRHEFLVTKVSSLSIKSIVIFLRNKLDSYDYKKFSDPKTTVLMSLAEYIKELEWDIVLEPPAPDMSIVSASVYKDILKNSELSLKYSRPLIEILKVIKPSDDNFSDLLDCNVFSDIKYICEFSFKERNKHDKIILYTGFPVTVRFKTDIPVWVVFRSELLDHCSKVELQLPNTIKKELNEFISDLKRLTKLLQCYNETSSKKIDFDLQGRTEEFLVSEEEDWPTRESGDWLTPALNRYGNNIIATHFDDFDIFYDDLQSLKLLASALEKIGSSKCRSSFVTNIVSILMTDFARVKTNKSKFSENKSFKDVYNVLLNICMFAVQNDITLDLKMIGNLSSFMSLSEKDYVQHIGHSYCSLWISRAILQSIDIEVSLTPESPVTGLFTAQILNNDIASSIVYFMRKDKANARFLQNLFIKSQGLFSKKSGHAVIRASFDFRNQFTVTQEHYRFAKCVSGFRSIDFRRSIIANMVGVINFHRLFHVKLDEKSLNLIYHILRNSRGQDVDEIAVFISQIICPVESRDIISRNPALSEFLESDVLPDELCDFKPLLHRDCTIYEKVITDFVLPSLKSRKPHITQFINEIINYFSFGGGISAGLVPIIVSGLNEYRPSYNNHGFLRFVSTFVFSSQNSKYEDCLTGFAKLFTTLRDHSSVVCSDEARKLVSSKRPDTSSGVDSLNKFYNTIHRSFCDIFDKQIKDIYNEGRDDLIWLCEVSTKLIKHVKENVPMIVSKDFESFYDTLSLFSDDEMALVFKSDTPSSSLMHFLKLFSTQYDNVITRFIEPIYSKLKSSMTYEHVKVICNWGYKVMKNKAIVTLIRNDVLEAIPKNLLEKEFTELVFQLPFLFAAEAEIVPLTISSMKKSTPTLTRASVNAKRANNLHCLSTNHSESVRASDLDYATAVAPLCFAGGQLPISEDSIDIIASPSCAASNYLGYSNADRSGDLLYINETNSETVTHYSNEPSPEKAPNADIFNFFNQL